MQYINFEFKVSKSDIEEYVLKSINDNSKLTFRDSKFGGT